jgi:hypothetical protein
MIKVKKVPIHLHHQDQEEEPLDVGLVVALVEYKDKELTKVLLSLKN